MGFLCRVLPWVFISRTTFAYHYFGGALFLVIAISYVFSELLERNIKNDKLLYAFTGLNTAMFVAFYPVLSGMEVSISYCINWLKWFPKWPWG